MVLPVLPERNGKPYPFLSTPFSEASGGAYPRWRADGKELYYVAPSNNLMAAGISAPGGATTGSIAPGQPVALFTANFARGPNRPQYDVARDGRFLGNVDLNDAATPTITLLQNWKPPK